MGCHRWARRSQAQLRLPRAPAAGAAGATDPARGAAQRGADGGALGRGLGPEFTISGSFPEVVSI